MKLDDFAEMWTSAPGSYALVRIESEGLDLVPVDLHQQAVVLIDEDDALIEGVVNRMVTAGVPVLDEVPW